MNDYALNPRRETCDRCGEVARGSASAWIDGGKVRLCHPDDPSAPDCYTIHLRDVAREQAKRWDGVLRLLAL